MFLIMILFQNSRNGVIHLTATPMVYESWISGPGLRSPELFDTIERQNTIGVIKEISVWDYNQKMLQWLLLASMVTVSRHLVALVLILVSNKIFKI